MTVVPNPRRAFAECRVDFVAYAYALCNRAICPGSNISIGSREWTRVEKDNSDGKGWRWLTAQSTQADGSSSRTFDVKITNDTCWRRKHSNTIESCYNPQRYFRKLRAFSSVKCMRWIGHHYLICLARHAIVWMLDALQMGRR